jgi:tetratricopeptide (TPR) repeat protein
MEVRVLIRRFLTAPLLFLLLGSSMAQMRTGNLHVRVTFTNGQPCTIKVRVQLMLSAGSTSVAENYTNDQGLADFDEVEIGNYHLIISGEGIEQTDSGMFEVDNRHGTQFQTVSVRRTDEVEQAKSSGATVAVQDMNIPKPALKQFNKASDLIAREDWKKALDLLNRAIGLYPQYVQAYNNLGVVYARLGDRTGERTALQKALSINDHFAPAWVNLARMAIVDRDFPAAENLLNKAIGFDPTDSGTLLILANVELMNLHYQQAIANCQKAHSLAQDSHSLVHFIAARAFEHENQISNAVAELNTFLKEEPSGIRADAARKELTSLQRLPQ